MEGIDVEFSVATGSNEEMLFGCLESLRSTMKDSPYAWGITVSCSRPGSGLAERLKALYPEVGVLETIDAGGVAASHNRALRLTRARYVWLLSDELRILPETVHRITEFMEKPQNSRVGLVGPRHLDPDGAVQASTRAFPSMVQILIGQAAGSEVSPVSGPAPDTVAEVDTLHGACVAVRTKAARQAGPMLENLSAGGEEAEWHRRFKDQAWKVVYFPGASVIHYGSQLVSESRRNRNPESLKGALYFFRTGRGQISYSMFCASLVTMFGVRTVIALFRGDDTGKKAASNCAAVAWDGLLRRSWAAQNR